MATAGTDDRTGGDEPDSDEPDFDEPDFDTAEATAEIVGSGTVTKIRRSGAGAVLNGVALGLRDVFDPVVKEEAPMTQEAPGEPDNPRQVDAHLDPDDPTSSSVTVRPWLFEES